MFINFEGVDGSGKTSVIQSITEYLKNHHGSLYSFLVSLSRNCKKINHFFN